MFALENVALQFIKSHTDELLHEQINVGADIADAVGGAKFRKTCRRITLLECCLTCFNLI